MPSPLPCTTPRTAPVRHIAALALCEGRLELRPSASDPSFCSAQLLPESQLWDTAGNLLHPTQLQVGDAVQLGGILSPQHVLRVAWLCRCLPVQPAHGG